MTPAIDETHERRPCWVPEADCHATFPVQNLPFGIFSDADTVPRVGVAIGDCILDLGVLSRSGQLPGIDGTALSASSLNRVMALPPAERRALRRRLFALLTDARRQETVAPALRQANACHLHLPAVIGDYTDFYAGIHHATNIGTLFRPTAPLLPNYKHVPIGYHGRASSVRPSGEPVRRPSGQHKPPDAAAPVFAASRRLDYELELGIWVGRGNTLGTAIAIEDAADHVSGFCLLNDWSARDVQAWEYQPLGPFLGKSFHTSVSTWVVTPEALAPFRVRQPARPDSDPAPLPYLWDEADQRHGALNLTLEVHLLTASMRAAAEAPYRLSRGPATSLYWTVAQLVAHHTSNGCPLNPGDLLGTGTISAETPDGWGSLMEITRNGSRPFLLPNGESRRFLNDGDEVILSAGATADGYASIGFGSCRAVVVAGLEG